MVDDMTETLIISTEEKIQLVKNEEIFRNIVGQRKDKVANKTAGS